MFKLNKTSIAIIILSFLLNMPLYSNADNEIAILYLTAAHSFFNENKIEETEAFLSKAFLYDQSLSDIYYINAKININLNGDVNSSIDYLEKAVTFRNWNLYRESNALFELGKLYVRIKDYERALSVLYVIRDQFIDNSDFLDFYTLLLINSGDFTGAQEYLSYAHSKYPDNNLFIKRLLRIDNDFRDLLLLRVLDQNNLYRYSPEVIIELSRLNQDSGVKRELISLAERAGNNSIELLFERMALAGRATINDVVIFSALNGFSDYKNINTIISMISSDRVVFDFLKEYFFVYSGHIRDDINNDGIFERIMFVENGIPQWYSEDNNQDNINDFFVGFQNGRPAFINIEEKMLVRYYRYPFIKTVILYGETYNEVYNFIDNRTHFDILEFSNPFVPPILKTANVSELFDSIKRSADTYMKRDLDSFTILLEYFKTEDIVDFRSIDQLNSIVRRGAIRNDRMIYRESDINQDDAFEIREIYRDGVLYEIIYDSSRSGAHEFVIRDGVRYWDFTGNGIYDVREWDEATDVGMITYREFATNMDGVFNFTAKYEERVLVEVKRDNEWKKVHRDSRNNIFWIGDETIEIGSLENLESGSYIFSGNRTVYIIKIGSDFFAEVIN